MGVVEIKPFAIGGWIVLAVLAVLGLISAVLWFVWPIFRFLTLTVVGFGISYLVYRYNITRNFTHLIGIVALFVVLGTCASVFLSALPSTKLSMAAGEAAEGATVGTNGFLLAFAPTILTLSIGVPLAFKYKKHAGVILFVMTSIFSMLLWVGLWVIG